MIDIERRRFVLPEHRALPAGRRPIWVYAMPRACDVRDARKAARKAAEEQGDASGLDGDVLQDQLLARCLRRLEGEPIMRGGEQLQVPESPDLEVRLTWAARLPVVWHPLVAKAIADGEDLTDAEVERAAEGRGEVAGRA